MNKQIEKIAHKATEEIVHRSKGDPDRMEVIIRQALRDWGKIAVEEVAEIGDAMVRGTAKARKKNPNRFYVSE